MKLTDEEIQAAASNQQLVMATCLKAMLELPEPAGIDPRVVTLSRVDGLLGAIAMLAEDSGMFRSEKERRRFAYECRSGILKSMQTAREDLRDVANDTTH